MAYVIEDIVYSGVGGIGGYRMFKPDGYDANPSNYPVHIFFHGRGERGDGTTEIDRVSIHGPLNLSNIPFQEAADWVVICPQLSTAYDWNWITQQVAQTFVPDMIAAHKIDTTRVSISGLSLGGYMVWDLIMKYPATFSAAVCVAGFDQAGTANFANASTVPLWSFHNSGDGVSPTSAAIANWNSYNAEGNLTALLSVYEATGHGGWTQTYNNTGGAVVSGQGYQIFPDTPPKDNIYDWLLSQSAGSIPPIADAGVDKNITLPVSSETFSGSATAGSGSIVSTIWTQQSGPNTASLSGETTTTLIVSGLIEGTYVFRLTVTDDTPLDDYDEVSIVVSPVAPQSPPGGAYPTSDPHPAGALQESDENIIDTTLHTTTDWASNLKSGDKATAVQIFNGYAYYVYCDGDARPKIVKSKTDGTDTTEAYLDNGADYTVQNEGHMIFSLGVDTDGYVHVSGDMHSFLPGHMDADRIPRYHGSEIMYWKSDSVENISAFSFFGYSAAGTRPDGTAWTYQKFYTDMNGQLFFSARVFANDDSHHPGEYGLGLYRYDVGTKTWTTLGGLHPDINGRVADHKVVFWEDNGQLRPGYPNVEDHYYQAFYNGMRIDANNVLHFSYSIFNDINKTIPTEVVYFKSTDSGDTWKRADDTVINAPVRATGSVDVGDVLYVGDVGGNLFSGNDFLGNPLSIYGYSLDGGTTFERVKSRRWNNVIWEAEIDTPNSITGYGTYFGMGLDKILTHFAGGDSTSNRIHRTRRYGEFGYYYTMGGQLTAIDFTHWQKSGELIMIVNDGVNQTLKKLTFDLNTPPTSDAGTDKSIILPVNSEVFTGSASQGTDPIDTTIWTQISGPNTASLSGDTTTELTVSGLIEGDYVFRLTVTDTGVLSDFDEVSISVLPEGTPIYSTEDVEYGGVIKGYRMFKPTGYDTETYDYKVVFFLHDDDERASDPWNISDLSRMSDKGPLTIENQAKLNTANLVCFAPQLTAAYSWDWLTCHQALVTFISDMVDAHKISTAHIYISGIGNGGAGMYMAIRLRPDLFAAAVPVACNNRTTEGSWTNAATVPMWAFHNTDDLLWLTANAITSWDSYDAEGIRSAIRTLYAETGNGGWIHTYNNTGGDVASGGYQAFPDAVPYENIYNWMLLQSEGAVVPPNANAGIDRFINQPTSSVILYGTATEGDGTILSTTWEQISGPATATLSGEDTTTLTVTYLTAIGVYVFRFTVLDDSPSSHSDECSVSVGSETTSFILPSIPNTHIHDIEGWLAYQEDEITKTQTEPPAVDQFGIITEWAPISLPSPKLGTQKHEVSKDDDGYYGLVYDFAGSYQIEKIYLWDTNGDAYDPWGTSTVRVSTAPYGDPANYTVRYEDFTDGTQTAKTITLGVEVGSVKVERLDRGIVPKIFFFGYAVIASDYTPPIEDDQTTRLPVSEFVGINSFIDHPVISFPNKYAREYYRFDWIIEGQAQEDLTYANMKMKFSPDEVGIADSHYEAKASAGIKMQVIFQGEISGLGSSYNDSNVAVAYPPTNNIGDDTEDPMSYHVPAKAMFNFTARYGSNSVISDGLLSLAVGQTIRKGLDLVDVIECGNEYDQDWNSDPRIHWRPAQMAAYMSAIIDGHKGTMGADCGIHTADPNMKIAMPALFKLNPIYIEYTFYYMAFMRGETVDVCRGYFYELDFHDYSQLPEGLFINPTIGVSPEEDAFDVKMSDLETWRNRYYPSTAIHLSEFGWDTNSSDQRAPAIINSSQQETQASWILRGLLYMYYYKIDKASVFWIRDDATDPVNAWRYAACGVNEEFANGFLPKFSYYAMSTFAALCNTCNTIVQNPHADSDVIIFKLTNESSINIYAAWLKTSVDASKSINIGIDELTATKVDITYGNSSGTETPLVVTTGEVSITLTEQVTFIRASDVPEPPIVDSGLDKSINLPNDSTVLTGSVTEGGVAIDTILWTQISGPNTATLVGDATIALTASDLIEGTYVFRLTVTDTNTTSVYDETMVIVNNLNPVVSAGVDKSTRLPNSSVVLNGEATETSYPIDITIWTQISGPNTATLAGEATTDLTASDLIEGVYIFRLTVTDTNSKSVYDEVSVVVNAEGVVLNSFGIRTLLI